MHVHDTYMHSSIGILTNMKKIKHVWCYALLLLSCQAFATASAILKNIEISLAAGPSWSHANNTTLTISPFETDSVRISQVTNATLWKVGVGFHALEKTLKNRQFINDLLLELNLYRSSETVRGNVWQYQLPQFDNYRFRTPVTSTRLMIDAKPGLFTWHQISPYPILGIGLGINKISYQESVIGIGVAPNSVHSLSNKSNSNFVYDLGVGARLTLTSNISASLEYLYTNLGKMSPSGTSTNNVALTSAPTFTIYNQTALVGLIWKF